MDSVLNSLLFSTPYLLCVVGVLLVLEQLSYIRRKGPLPGPMFIVPFIGSAVPMILNPTRYWNEQARRAAAAGGLAADYLFGRFTVFVHPSELSHKVFANVRSDAFHLIGHPFGKKLFGEHNLIYMFDQPHRDLRRRIAPNFTPKALSTYLPLQQRVILTHMSKWVSLSHESPTPLRIHCRDMNLDTSQTVFVGSYLSPAARSRFNKDYALFNAGVMAAPFDFPGFAFRRARLAVDRLITTLSECVSESRSRMRAGEQPACLVDFWMHEEVAAETAEKLSNDAEKGLHQSSDLEIGGHLFDFLFAAQDASTSSLLWAVTLLESHPTVLERVRAEVSAIWNPSSGELITAEQLRSMRYTESVAREVIRFRPPATMVPHIAGKDFEMTEWYTVPKGTIVFPSAFESSFQGFTQPDQFDPDRFSEERGEDHLFKRNYLAFGAGPHQCVGQRYAINNLIVFIALFVSMVDFRRHRTEGCDDLAYVPTITPQDDCLVYLTGRNATVVKQ